MTCRRNLTCAAAFLCMVCGAALAGCATSPGGAAPAVRPAQVRSLNLDAYQDPAERDRAALVRFVGAWDYDGWYDPPDQPRRQAAGIAAGTIEHRHFVLLDSAEVAQQGGIADFQAGSMLLSSEPGIGLMLTAWSGQAPAVHRCRGTVEAEGSRFVFDEFRPIRTQDRLRMIVRFETDDRWVIDFYRRTGGKDVLAASYTFTRSAAM